MQWFSNLGVTQSHLWGFYNAESFSHVWPPTLFLTQQVWGGARSLAFLTSFQLVLVLLVPGHPLGTSASVSWLFTKAGAVISTLRQRNWGLKSSQNWWKAHGWEVVVGGHWVRGWCPGPPGLCFGRTNGCCLRGPSQLATCGIFHLVLQP